jgi:predicted acyltransferase
MALFSPAYPLTPTGNLVGYLDRLLVSPARLYTPLFDPEGLLSTLPAIATALIGNVIAEFLLVSCASKKQLHILIAAGLILLSLGGIYSFFCPINKSLWSSSFVLWTGGLALVGFASCFALIEIAQWRAWTKPFQLFGKNAFLVYVLHVVFLKIQAIILIQNQAGELTNLRLYLTNALFGSLSAESASFSYALSYILFWFCILTALSQVRLKDLR